MAVLLLQSRHSARKMHRHGNPGELKCRLHRGHKPSSIPQDFSDEGYWADLEGTFHAERSATIGPVDEYLVMSWLEIADA
jgi:hypothetical protein